MTADEELLSSSLRRLGDGELDDAELDRRVINFRGALWRLRDDPAEAARIDALVTAAELGQANAKAADSGLLYTRPGRGSAIGNLLAGSDESSLDDEAAEVLFAHEEPPGVFVLDHKWVLYDRLPGADDGGGGIVWRARNRLGDVRDWFVVKTVPSGLIDRRTTQYIQQLSLRHEQRAAGVASAHVGQIIDHGDDRGVSYLVYPMYRPGSLATYCRWIGDRRTLGWCAQVIDEVLSGLITASVVGLVHLDIKPGNIVLDGDHARVIDWGLSRVWNASQASTWITRGTPFFACPEQLIDPHAGWDTPRADLYGVGATFYWLLTGEAPLQRDAYEPHDLVEYRRLLLAGVRPQPVHELVTGIPRPLSALVDSWLSFDPDRRVPPGTPMADSLRVARDQPSALRPLLPEMTLGQVTARRQLLATS